MKLIDAHHHLWAGQDDDFASPYEANDYLADIAGVDVQASVFLECFSHYDRTLPEPLQSTGETRYVAGVAEQFAAGPGPRLAAAIVAYADPFATEDFGGVRDAHLAAGGRRLRGIRRCVTWDPDPALNYPTLHAREGMLRSRVLRDALAALAERDLHFETWLYHPQIGELADLAGDAPATTIVLKHVGTPLGVGRYAGDARVWTDWREATSRLAERPNVWVKLGGFVMHGSIFDAFREAQGLDHWTAPVLAERIAPYVDHLLATFGPERCLFESNFPIDKPHCRYGDIVEACRLAVAGHGPEALEQVFAEAARRLYRI